jgi:phage gpG-like protein
MPVQIRFTFFGSTQIDRTLANYERAADMRPVWEELRKRFLRLEQRQFSSEGSAGGERWSPLSPDYGAWKMKHHPGAKILHLSGELEHSLTEGPQINIMEPKYAIFGSAVEHGVYHQHGTERMPKRPPVVFPEAERQEWVGIIQRFLATGHAR